VPAPRPPLLRRVVLLAAAANEGLLVLPESLPSSDLFGVLGLLPRA
jgi:hypothetical protein